VGHGSFWYRIIPVPQISVKSKKNDTRRRRGIHVHTNMASPVVNMLIWSCEGIDALRRKMATFPDVVRDVNILILKKVDAIPLELNEFRQLSELWLGGNEIRDLSALGSMQHLHTSLRRLFLEKKQDPQHRCAGELHAPERAESRRQRHPEHLGDRRNDEDAQAHHLPEHHR
jgi:hypothetical protein